VRARRRIERADGAWAARTARRALHLRALSRKKIARRADFFSSVKCARCARREIARCAQIARHRAKSACAKS